MSIIDTVAGWLSALKPRDAISLLLAGLVLTGGYAVKDMRVRAEEREQKVAAAERKADAAAARVATLEQRAEKQEAVQTQASKDIDRRLTSIEEMVRDIHKDMLRSRRDRNR